MDVIRKEEYEIDPNSSFNRLRTLQKNLKEENALRENYSKTKDELLKKIDSHCYRYYKTKIAIHELYDMPIHSELNKMKYVVAENGQAELPQCYEPLYNLMFAFRNDNTMMLKLIEKSSINQYDNLATFIVHFFYENLLSSNQDSEDLLVILYLLIEKEIDGLKDINSYDNFLNQSKSFLARIFNNLSKKNDVRNYLEIILHKLIIDFENLNNKTNETNSHINLDFKKIKDELNAEKKKEKKIRKVTDYKTFLTSKVRVSNIFNSLNQILRETKNKDTMITFYEENKQIIDFNAFAKRDEQELFTYDSIEQYFEEHGLYEKESSTSITESEMTYNTSYSDDLTQTNIQNILKFEKNADMIVFLQKQLETLQQSKDDKIFTTNMLINEIGNDKDLKENAEKIILVYKYTFEKIKEYIDYIIFSILQNKHIIPYIIKYICVIINRLLTKKFPKSSVIARNTFICNFFFDNLIIHELKQPVYNGLVPELTKSDAKRRKIDTLERVLKQIMKGNFFCGNNDKDKMYTMFNSYFLEIMPCLFEVCKELKQVKLPRVIEQLIASQDKDITKRDINYDYLKDHPDEFIHLQSMCFSLDDFDTIYNIIKSNDQYFCPDKTSFFGKTFKKLTFHEKTLNKKKSADQEKNKKTFVFLTKTNYSNKVKDSVFAQKSQKFSFQSGNEEKENANEFFIFERVKYSINTIVKHLNTLTRANFSADSESMENFVKGLNTMIELEGFSEILKEKTIPLDWFGLYLQSNIGGIPQSKSRANYYQLYSDLIDDSQANFNIIKNDDTLNCVNSKTKISQKNVEIQLNTLKNYQSMLRMFHVSKFFDITDKYNICLKITHKDGIPTKIIITASEDVCKGKTGFFEKKKTKHVDMNCISQLFEEFPDLTMETTETDILNYQMNNGFRDTFPSFFKTLKNIIKKYITLTNENDDEEEFNLLFIEIQNIIFRKLHHKLCPDMASEKDLTLFRKCFNFSWIRPEHLHKDLYVVNDEMLTLASEYIKNLDNEISPYDKIKMFAKAYEIVESTTKMFDIKGENALIMLLTYVFIKSQYMGFDSKYLYMTLYLTEEQRTPYYEKVFSMFGKAKEMVEKLTKENLINITDEEYKRNVEKVYSGNQ